MTGAGFAIIVGGTLGLLILAVTILFAWTSELRERLERLDSAILLVQRDLYQHQEQDVRGFKVLGLEWGPGTPPGWRKP